MCLKPPKFSTLKVGPLLGKPPTLQTPYITQGGLAVKVPERILGQYQLIPRSPFNKASTQSW